MAFFLTLALASAAAITPSTYDTDCAYTNSTRHGIAEVLYNWGQVWKGNWTAWNETVIPNVSVYQDRIPTTFNGTVANPFDTQFLPINNASVLRGFIEKTREEFDHYGFIQQFHFVESGGGKLVTRWTLNATVGAKSSSPVLKQGDQITCNGTDILIFDDCSGRIAQVITAQDLMDYTYKMGMNIEHRPDMRGHSGAEV
ncbi:hypothetical protein AC579_2390 [Pseudocercospora musae]|uniref:SnoaL-like domain-containing protein n=1 Tax=Pseudocercospora musae TaxID=113226 RepID=A0A139IH82_9PEZI|nr:hypothetical protein AC579_2390 [Pseudocercospora musae]